MRTRLRGMKAMCMRRSVPRACRHPVWGSSGTVRCATRPRRPRWSSCRSLIEAPAWASRRGRNGRHGAQTTPNRPKTWIRVVPIPSNLRCQAGLRWSVTCGSPGIGSIRPGSRSWGPHLPDRQPARSPRIGKPRRRGGRGFPFTGGCGTRPGTRPQEDQSPMAERSVHRTLNSVGEGLDDGA